MKTDSGRALSTDPLHVWTTDEELATVGPERGPVGQAWEYIGTNYLLLGLIIEHVTGRPLAEVLRSGVLDGDGYERLIYQPDERPTDPMAMPFGAPADTFDEVGGYLPSLAGATALHVRGRHGFGLTEPRPMVQRTVRRSGRLGCVARRDDRLRRAT